MLIKWIVFLCSISQSFAIDHFHSLTSVLVAVFPERVIHCSLHSVGPSPPSYWSEAWAAAREREGGGSQLWAGRDAVKNPERTPCSSLQIWMERRENTVADKRHMSFKFVRRRKQVQREVRYCKNSFCCNPRSVRNCRTGHQVRLLHSHSFYTQFKMIIQPRPDLKKTNIFYL